MVYTRAPRYRRAKYPRKALGAAQRKQVVSITKNVVSRKIEKANHLFTTSGVASNAGAMNALLDITQGTGDGQRLKHQITLKSVHLNMLYTHADPTNVIRVIVFQYFDRAFPTLADILQLGTGATANYLSPFNFDNSKAFRVLYDSTKLMNDVDRRQVHINKYIKLSKARKDVEFDGSTSAGTNRLYMLTMSDSTAISHPTYIGHVVVKYTDS